MRDAQTTKKAMIGKCHICGQITRLSKEHVPPQGAFNKQSKKMFSGDTIFGRENLPWDFSGINGEQHQGGVGWYRLCKKCNNDTGSWYVPAYVGFARQGLDSIVSNNFPEKEIEVLFKGVYPLRIIKEITAMFAASAPAGFLERNIQLRKFILNKEEEGIDEDKYFMGAYVNKGPFQKYTGITATSNFESGATRVVAEISALPFGFILEIDPKDPQGYSNITSFAKYGYHQKASLKLSLPVYETNTSLPMDYRTKAEVLADRERNMKYVGK